MAKLDWERPKFAWERKTSENDNCVTPTRIKRALQKRKRFKNSSIKERRFKNSVMLEIDKTFNDIKKRVISDKSIQCLSITRTPTKSSMKVIIVTPNISCYRALIIFLKSINICEISKRTTKKGNVVAEFSLIKNKTINDKHSSYKQNFKFNTSHMDDYQTVIHYPPTPFETSYPIIIERICENRRYKLAITRKETRYIKGDIFLVRVLDCNSYGDFLATTLRLERSGSIEIYVQAVDTLHKDGIRYADFFVLDLNYSRIAERRSYNQSHSIISAYDEIEHFFNCAILAVNNIIEQLQSHSWDYLVSLNPSHEG